MTLYASPCNSLCCLFTSLEAYICPFAEWMVSFGPTPTGYNSVPSPRTRRLLVHTRSELASTLNIVFLAIGHRQFENLPIIIEHLTFASLLIR
jgi:hypothetical protein